MQLSATASQAVENSQSTAVHRTHDRIQYSNRPDLQKKPWKNKNTVGTHHLICKAVELEQSALLELKIQNRHNVIIDYNNSSNFEYLGLQTK